LAGVPQVGNEISDTTDLGELTSMDRNHWPSASRLAWAIRRFTTNDGAIVMAGGDVIASFDQPEPGPARGTVLLRSTLDGALIGAGAGMVYGIVVGLWGSVGPAPTLSGFLGLATVAGLVAVPAGIALGAVFGAGFGLAALARVRHLAWLEVAVVAVFGGLILALAIAGSDGVISGLLAWTAGPLLVGMPAAALHGWRSQRRVA
jgi:hypothetical protein